jgi:hypothetical protein
MCETGTASNEEANQEGTGQAEEDRQEASHDQTNQESTNQEEEHRDQRPVNYHRSETAGSRQRA